MKTAETILKEKYLHPLSKLERIWVIEAMIAYAEQAIDRYTEIGAQAYPNIKANLIAIESTVKSELR